MGFYVYNIVMYFFVLIVAPTFACFAGKHSGSVEDKQEMGCPLSTLSSLTLCSIADFLEGENKNGKNDFANFALASKKIYQTLVNNPSLFCPTPEQEIINAIKLSPFNHLPILSFKWSRMKKFSLLPKLSKLSLLYDNHAHVIPMTPADYAEKMDNFEMYLKFKILSFLLEKESTNTEIKTELVRLKYSKLFAYRLNSSSLNASFESVRFRRMQGAIVSQKILQYLKKNFYSKQFSSIRLEILARENYFKFVNDFFSHITCPQEETLLSPYNDVPC